MITSGILATVMLAKAAMRARKARKQAPSQSSLLFEDWNINFNLPPKLITRCAVCWRRRSAKGSMWKRKGACKVALKMLDNSKDIRPEFLHELRAHYKCLSSGLVLTCYGITQHPDTKDYMMVMDYAKQGDLTHFLRTHMANSDWYRKVRELWYIAQGLKAIHDADLVHKDFHNYNFAHDASLALDITKGLRPQILEGTPKQYVELMKLCWQKDPIGRPSAAELVKKLEMLLNDQEINNGVVPTIHIDENYHPDAVYTSRALQFPDLKNAKFDSKFENMENDTN
ncbi:17649_t:CDS:2, partial [Gigaspora rosea]